MFSVTEGELMFIDMTGWTGAEHAREMRRNAPIDRVVRDRRRSHRLRGLTARTELNPTYNYRSR
jgi:hypothetical protein